MLKLLQVSNFVKFREKQTLTFDEGLNIFVGGNDSGKTCLLEGIRRCLSIKRSTTLSTAYNDDKLSYVACAFDDVEHANGKAGQIISCFLRLPENGAYYKVVACRENVESQWELGCDELRVDHNNALQNEQVDIESCKIESLTHPLGDCQVEDLEPFLMEIVDYVKGIQLHHSAFSLGNLRAWFYWILGFKTKCEELLSNIKDGVVATFPSRSIGPLQWTLSKKVSNAFKEENYREAVEKAEILLWFLQNGTESEKNSEFTLFKKITGGSKYQFDLDQDKILARVEDSLSLLKVPEGILEAKTCSILMAVEKFQTVCMEEPDRGMHPQMISRLRKVLLDVKNRVVIITSHHQGFIDIHSADRVFLFNRIQTGEKPESQVKSLREILTAMDKQGQVKKGYSERTTAVGAVQNRKGQPLARIRLSEHFAEILFTDRILWVEGVHDYWLITALLSKARESSDNNTEQRAHHEFPVFVKAMNTKTEYRNLFPFCYLLGKKGYFVLDKDVISVDFMKWLYGETEKELTKVARAARDEDSDEQNTGEVLNRLERCILDVLKTINLWDKREAETVKAVQSSLQTQADMCSSRKDENWKCEMSVPKASQGISEEKKHSIRKDVMIMLKAKSWKTKEENLSTRQRADNCGYNLKSLKDVMSDILKRDNSDSNGQNSSIENYIKQFLVDIFEDITREVAREMGIFIWKEGAIEEVVMQDDGETKTLPKAMRLLKNTGKNKPKLFSNKTLRNRDILELAEYLLNKRDRKKDIDSFLRYFDDCVAKKYTLLVWLGQNQKEQIKESDEGDPGRDSDEDSSDEDDEDLTGISDIFAEDD